MAAYAGLCLAWSETPEDTFCRVMAHMYTTSCNVSGIDIGVELPPLHYRNNGRARSLWN